MSEQQTPEVESQDHTDDKTDMWAIVIIFTTAVVMAMHFVSGFTFDF